jgi:hypothetical protein
MKRIAVVALLLFVLAFVGTLSATQTKASAGAQLEECKSTNPPPPETPCYPFYFVGCQTDPSNDVVYEVYASRFCEGVYIHRPIN